MKQSAFLALLVVALGGCQSAPLRNLKALYAPDIAKQELAAAIGQYEEGNYRGAERLLRSSLDYGFFSKADRVQARKYLAFIYCASNRTSQCRSEFGKILRIDPTFTLAANEAGHPMWGPVFHDVRESRASELATLN